MTNEHKHAALLRLAADNKDQLFECEELGEHTILGVLKHTQYTWRPVKSEQKKIKRWLWANKDRRITIEFYSEAEIKNTSNGSEFTKLLWSETEFEVSDE